MIESVVSKEKKERDIGRESWLIGSGGIYCRGNGINNSYIPIGRLKLQESSQINGGINSVILLYSQDSLQTLRNINKNKKDTNFEKLEGRRYYLRNVIEKYISSASITDYKIKD